MLTKKQLQLLEFIRSYQRENGVAPSYDEMRMALTLKSKSGVASLLQSLAEKGYVRKLEYKARAIEILKDTWKFEQTTYTYYRGDNVATGGRLSDVLPSAQPPGTVRVTLHGSIAAGLPLEVFESAEETVEIPRGLVSDTKNIQDYFALKIIGQSMIEAGILDGDVVILVRNPSVESGDIVAALIDSEEITLKKFHYRNETVILEPANRDFIPQEYAFDRVRVIGKLAGLLRNY